MKILFTGGSSLTGMWFVKELVQAGHQVTACFRSPFPSYTGLRRKRVELLNSVCENVFNCPFGTPFFLEIIQQNDWDLFCHHAADVANYKSPDFNPAIALANNSHGIKHVLEALIHKNCHKILLTGSVFEQNEGKGSDDLRAVSPYGLSKGLTSEVFRYYTTTLKMKLGKFVIPNPFGPYEEVRYTSYLIQAWLKREIPIVRTPDYVRDNIPVSLLAKAYAAFARGLTVSPGCEKTNPSFYLESQGAFTARFAQEMAHRLSLPCRYEIGKQVDFSEPLIRVNDSPLNPQELQWDETHAWNELAEFYRSIYGGA